MGSGVKAGRYCSQLLSAVNVIFLCCSFSRANVAVTRAHPALPREHHRQCSVCAFEVLSCFPRASLAQVCVVFSEEGNTDAAAHPLNRCLAKSTAIKGRKICGYLNGNVVTFSFLFFFFPFFSVIFLHPQRTFFSPYSD